MFNWILSTIEQWGYSGLFFLMVLENVFPPIPSELIVPLAGFLAASGQMNPALVILIGTVGSVIGTTFWYYIGLWIGEERLKRFAARHGRLLTLSPSDIDKAHRWFLRYGGMAVFIGRLIPTLRTLISVPAGFARMPIWTFLFYTTLGSLIGTSMLAVAGYLLQSQYALVADWIDPISKAIVVIVVAVYLYRVITWKPH
ncbi:DedA family protein [Paracoccus aminophilus]|uniref:DedA family protein n=1 Tax=Paracoccus aminophilus JCM 7686 TaxID=1367847 RepID=S5YSE7_PARAH|nr:DedA family protein [Paracoccus aminophilus]AGT08141.1 DedA family protein [Paracoccus aminophilus JCM 7686]